MTSIAAERQLSRAEAHWARGELAEAHAALERLRKARGDRPEILFPLARVLFERGEPDAARDMLAAAAAAHPGSNAAATLLGALGHYDYGDIDRADELASELEGENAIAHTLRALIRLEQTPERREADEIETNGKPSRLSLHRGALWIAETGGRLLAALETRLEARGRDAFASFHHRELTSQPDAARGSSSEPAGSREPRPGTPGTRADWAAALDRAFESADMPELIRVYECAPEGADWSEPILDVYYGYALVTTGVPGRALDCIASVLRDHPENAWAHFVGGLACTGPKSRFGRIAALVRAFRHADHEIQRLTSPLARELGVEIDLID